LLDDATKARDWFAGCGSEVAFDKLRRVRHRDIGYWLERSKATKILEWFTARPNACVVKRDHSVDK
jgi:hypothetical protein